MTADAVLFDLDGVLADSRRPIIDCINAALVAVGLPPRPEAEVERTIGPPAPVGFSELLGLASDSATVTEAIRHYRALYVEALWDTPSYPGVPQAVRALAEERLLGVATSKPLRYAEPVLEALGLADAFAVVAGPVEDGPDDKHAMVAQAVERLGGAAAMVGDRRYDMEAAVAHGLAAIGVTWGFGTRQELLDAGAQALVDQPADLLAVARRLSRSTPRAIPQTPPIGG